MSITLGALAHLLERDEAGFRTRFVRPVLVWASPTAAVLSRSVAEFLPQRTLMSGDHPRKPASGPVAFELAKSEGNHDGLPDAVSIGRSMSNDVVLDHHGVSRRHAFFTANGDERWHLTDAGSRNGTWLDGTKLEPRYLTPVSDGAVVLFGKVEVRFLLPESFIAELRRR